MLNVEELFELEENIKEELDDHLTAALSRMNRSGQLEDFLRLLGMEHLLHKESGYEVYKTGKIVVIGQPGVKPEVLLSIAKQLGLDKKRFELYLEYEDAKKFNFQKTNTNICPLNIRIHFLQLKVYVHLMGLNEQLL